MIRERIPTAPQRMFEKSYRQLVSDVQTLMTQKPFQPDQMGRFRIGDVYLIQQVKDDGVTISLSAQNANTDGPVIHLGDLV